MPEERRATVIGAGLAGSEAAWQLARRGIRVTLTEMKPEKMSPAHHSPLFAELVCSNSFRGDRLTNAVGLLKEEMRILEEQFLNGKQPDEIPTLRKHADWFRAVCESRAVTKENIHGVLFEEIGKTFVRVLEDAGVYKTTPEGLQGFLRFLEPFRGE